MASIVSSIDSSGCALSTTLSPSALGDAPDGAGELITRVGGGAGGYAPGPLIENQMRKLSTVEVKHFLHQINGAHFWELPTEEKKKSTFVEIDGAQWILEGIQDADAHIVDRWSPKKGEYRTLRWFLKF